MRFGFRSDYYRRIEVITGTPHLMPGRRARGVRLARLPERRIASEVLDLLEPGSDSPLRGPDSALPRASPDAARPLRGIVLNTVSVGDRSSGVFASRDPIATSPTAQSRLAIAKATPDAVPVASARVPVITRHGKRASMLVRNRLTVLHVLWNPEQARMDKPADAPANGGIDVPCHPVCECAGRGKHRGENTALRGPHLRGPASGVNGMAPPW